MTYSIATRPEKRTIDDLRGYQVAVIDHIVRTFEAGKPGVLLDLDMGLGKTVSSLTAAAKLLRKGEIRKILIVAPVRVAMHTWPAEIASWAHLEGLTHSVMCGTKKKREVALSVDADIHIVNRENLPWLHKELASRGARWPWDLLIYDESSRMKSGRFKTKSGALSEYGIIMDVRRWTKFSILLTGTPAPGGIQDIYPQIRAIDSGQRLGRNITAFRERWMRPDYSGYNWIPVPGATDEILEKVRDVMISMSADDHITLPPVIRSDIEVDLPPKVLKGYRRFATTMLSDDGVLAASEAVLAGKLLQYASGGLYPEAVEGQPRGAAIDIHTSKIDGLRELREATEGEPLLVAYGYKFDKARLLAAFPEAVSADDDPDAIDKWNRGEIQMLIAHPASIGHGLNLQYGGRRIVWYGMTWSLELYQQFNARLRRPGQRYDTVYIHHIIAKNTIDERILRAVDRKGAKQDDIRDAVRLEVEEV